MFNNVLDKSKEILKVTIVAAAVAGVMVLPTVAQSDEPVQKARELEQQNRHRNAQFEESKAQESDEHQQRVCRRRQETVSNRTQVIADAVAKHNGYLDSLFQRVHEYVTTHQLQVANYEGLKKEVLQAQTVVNQAQEALADTEPVLNCKNSNNRDDVKSFQNQVAESVDSLKAYKEALKQLIKEVKQAALAASGRINR